MKNHKRIRDLKATVEGCHIVIDEYRKMLAKAEAEQIRGFNQEETAIHGRMLERIGTKVETVPIEELEALRKVAEAAERLKPYKDIYVILDRLLDAVAKLDALGGGE